MWCSVDRIEDKRTVVLIDDDEKVYHLSLDTYTRMTGIPPSESHMLQCTTENGRIVSAVFSPEETERRQTAARERLRRLFTQKQT